MNYSEFIQRLCAYYRFNIEYKKPDGTTGINYLASETLRWVETHVDAADLVAFYNIILENFEPTFDIKLPIIKQLANYNRMMLQRKELDAPYRATTLDSGLIEYKKKNPEVVKDVEYNYLQMSKDNLIMSAREFMRKWGFDNATKFWNVIFADITDEDYARANLHDDPADFNSSIATALSCKNNKKNPMDYIND